MNYGQTGSSTALGASSIYQEPPVEPALELIRKRLAEVGGYLIALHDIADRAYGPTENLNGGAASSPNGLLGQIEQDLDAVVGMASGALNRFRRLA